MQETWVAPSSVWGAMVVVHCAPSTVPSTISVASSGGVPPSVDVVAGPPLQPATMTSASALAAATGHGAVDLTLALPLLRVFTLVPALLSVNQGQLGLHAALLLIQRQRDQRAPFFSNLSGQAIDLSSVQQQLALAARVVVALVGEGEDADVHLVQPGLPAIDVREGVDQRDL